VHLYHLHYLEEDLQEEYYLNHLMQLHLLEHHLLILLAFLELLDEKVHHLLHLHL
tara:strand:- start:187 stop:351 length:165 start_codon:yes stop_codon:yes gene_type:complete